MCPVAQSATLRPDLASGDNAEVFSMSDSREGQVLNGTYRIVRRLSAGGMGTVYQARALGSGRDVAIKILHAEYAHRRRVVQRFVREAAIAAGLSSDHVVGVVDSGEVSGVPFLVMELLLGQDLRQLLRCEGPLATARAVSIILDVSEGVRAAHEAGLIHRDLKPANIFVTRRDDGRELAKILDFGVAKLRGLTETTGEGSLIGTVGYMAPEQVISSKSVDHRADIFALGLILREALCGEPPHRGERAELLFRALYSDIPALRIQCPDIPDELDNAVLRAIARDPERRYPNVMAFADALRPFARAQSAANVRSGSAAPFPRARSFDVTTSMDSSLEEERQPSLPMAAAMPAPRAGASVRRLQTRVGAAVLVVAVGLWLANELAGSSAPPAVQLPEESAASTATPASPPSSGEGDTLPLVSEEAPTPAPEVPEPVIRQAPKTGSTASMPNTARAAPSEEPITLPGVHFDPTNPYQSPRARLASPETINGR